MLRKHMRSKHSKIVIKCKKFDYEGPLRGNYKRHLRSVHGDVDLKCKECRFVSI